MSQYCSVITQNKVLMNDEKSLLLSSDMYTVFNGKIIHSYAKHLPHKELMEIDKTARYVLNYKKPNSVSLHQILGIKESNSNSIMKDKESKSAFKKFELKVDELHSAEEKYFPSSNNPSVLMKQGIPIQVNTAVKE